MDERGDGISDRDFRRLVELIGVQCGIAVAPAKRVMLETRLKRRVRSLGMKSLAVYCDYLHSPAGREELPSFIDAVTTHKTDFFREPAHFDFLTERGLAELARTCGAGVRRPLLAWSAASSTGEEPYTLAMVLAGYAESLLPESWEFRIEASDISEAVLETARRAVYSEAAVRPVSRRLCQRFVLRSRERDKALVRMAPEIRSRVFFRRINLMDSSYGFSEPLDLVLCRNVMIYFDRPTQQTVLARVSRTLRPGGYLLMGHSESLYGLDLPLMQVSPTIYRRSDG